MSNKVEQAEIHKEIDLIQSCVNRMAQNSFMLKGWLVTLYAVILGLLPERVNIWLLCAVLITITVSFWYLDAFFLRTERIYRNIYEWVLKVRPQGNRELLYDLNPKNYKGKINEVDNIYKTMISPTLKCFYGIPIILVLVIIGFNILPYLCRIPTLINSFMQ